MSSESEVVKSGYSQDLENMEANSELRQTIFLFALLSLHVRSLVILDLNFLPVPSLPFCLDADQSSALDATKHLSIQPDLLVLLSECPA